MKWSFLGKLTWVVSLLISIAFFFATENIERIYLQGLPRNTVPAQLFGLNLEALLMRVACGCLTIFSVLELFRTPLDTAPKWMIKKPDSTLI